MRLIALLLTAILAAPAVSAQGLNGVATPTPVSPRVDGQAAAPKTGADGQTTDAQQKDKEKDKEKAKDTNKDQAEPTLNLPVSVNRIRQALAQPAEPLRGLKGLDETPTFRVEVRERMKIEELLQTLNFKSGPPVPGGLYGYEQQRQLFPSVSNPLVQPYAAFNQGELMTILVENLVGRYLAGRAMSSISAAERAHAEAAAKEEVSHAISEYCAAQPNHGAGIQICVPAR